MYTSKSILHRLQLGLAAAVIVGMGGAAQAATVTFSDIVDGDGSTALFDTSQTVASGNILDIGLNNFTADGSSFPSALDTLSMTITAPAGYTITSISYTEGGFGVAQNGVALATGSIVADNQPINFPTEMFNPGDLGEWSITPESPGGGGLILIDNKESISVSITNSLLAVAFDTATIVNITTTRAFLEVTTEEIPAVPLPAAVWMFGSALISLVIGARRRRGAATA